MGKPTLKSHVGIQEGLHFLGVAGAYHHKLSGVVFHAGEELLDGVVALRACALACGVHGLYVVSLVQEKHASHGLVYGRFHVLGALALDGGDNLGGGLFRNPVCGSYAKGLENLSESAGYRGLARSWISREDEIEPCKAFPSLSKLNEALLNRHFLRNPPYGILHLRHSHKGIHLLHHFLHGNALHGILSGNVGISQDIVLLSACGCVLDCRIKEVPHLTGVAKGVRTLKIHFLADARQHFIGLRVQGKHFLEVVFLKHQAEELLQFLCVIVRELYGNVAAGRDTRISAHKLSHFLGVACHYAHELSAAVLKNGKKGVYCIHAKASAVDSARRLAQGVCLVNEKDAAHGLVHGISHILFRVAKILPQKGFCLYLHKLAGWEGTD